MNAAGTATGNVEFVRTFLVPGMNHCAGGPATDAFDGLSALVDRVETGRAPDRLWLTPPPCRGWSGRVPVPHRPPGAATQNTDGRFRGAAEPQPPNRWQTLGAAAPG